MLSMVSFFTDIASETLYPVMPVFLKSIGFSVLWIGLLEGLAEATAGLTKGYFGRLSDVRGKRLPFVRIGYTLSALSKPLMAVSVIPLWIFFARVMDRFGKGLRTAPRDALLAVEATPETKGRIFGLHRSMDTAGAVVGPVLALVYLYFYPGNYHYLFLLAFLPGLISVGFTFLVRENAVPSPTVEKVSFFSFLKYWRIAPPVYRKLLLGLVCFALINSSDLFLLLRAKEAGLSDTGVIGIYIFYNLIYAIFAFPAGVIADRFGLLGTLVFGIVLFAAVYGGMSFEGSIYWYASLFIIYGIYSACVESIAKALISNLVAVKDTATALGTYNALQSLATLVASSLAGFIWFSLGAKVLFISISVCALLVSLYLASLKQQLRMRNS